tara:strand:- start:15513 stop:16967 length:1455 start_codon:yes stop_codon:yes gene_type:complete
MSIKEKAIAGFSWTAFEGFFSQGVIFIVGIILARLLTPEDFGIIGIVSVFIAISGSLVEGGFNEALIQKLNVSNKDFNTVFYSNLVVSLLLYVLIFFLSGKIADFFKEDSLELILKYSGLIIIINSFSIVQYAMLTIKLNFRIISIIKVIASIISVIVALYLAYNNYGIWSLVVLSILRPLIGCILLWTLNKWRPALIFSVESFKNLFDFGYKMLVSKLITAIYGNLYYILIGKFFSPTSLGYYTRADQFQAPFSANITVAVSRISYPILASLQNDKVRLKSVFRKFLRFSVFINFAIMLGIAAIAKPLVLLTVGEKWSNSILYLRILCIPGMLYPIQILNINLLTALGNSNLMLKLEVIKKIILIPLIISTAFFSIEIMLYGLVLFSLIEFFINSWYTKKLINYSIIDQMKDITPFLIISFTTFLSMYLVSLLKLSLLGMIISQILIGVFIFFLINERLKLNEYLEVKSKISSTINKVINWKK